MGAVVVCVRERVEKGMGVYVTSVAVERERGSERGVTTTTNLHENTHTHTNPTRHIFASVTPALLTKFILGKGGKFFSSSPKVPMCVAAKGFCVTKRIASFPTNAFSPPHTAQPLIDALATSSSSHHLHSYIHTYTEKRHSFVSF